ncbi:MAG: hypothetical protein R3F56_17180 [Planctomycetota bacterium]
MLTPPADPRATRPIELRVRDMAQLFHSLDPSPFHDRDLDREAARFIREEAADRGRAALPAIVVRLPSRQLAQEEAIRNAVRIHFARECQSAQRELRQLMRFGRFALLAGLAGVFVVVAVGRALLSLAPAGTLTAGLAESLTIVGWVFLWRPAEVLLFDRWPIRQRIDLFRRLSSAEVRCVGVEE